MNNSWSYKVSVFECGTKGKKSKERVVEECEDKEEKEESYGGFGIVARTWGIAWNFLIRRVSARRARNNLRMRYGRSCGTGCCSCWCSRFKIPGNGLGWERFTTVQPSRIQSRVVCFANTTTTALGFPKVRFGTRRSKRYFNGSSREKNPPADKSWRTVVGRN